MCLKKFLAEKKKLYQKIDSFLSTYIGRFNFIDVDRGKKTDAKGHFSEEKKTKFFFDTFLGPFSREV